MGWYRSYWIEALSTARTTFKPQISRQGAKNAKESKNNNNTINKN
jgi:hypothetical protein